MKNRIFSIGGILISILFWILESSVHYLMFDEEKFEFIPSDVNELWMRLIIVFLIVSFSFFADFKSNRLKESKKRIRVIIDNAVDGMITIDKRGIIESFNPAAEKLFGYSPSDIIGQSIKILMPEPYHSEYDHYLDHYRRTGESKIIGPGREMLAQKKDGRIIPI